MDHVRVQSISGLQYTFPVNLPQTTVRALQYQISEKIGLSPQIQKLYWNQKELIRKEATLQDYGIPTNGLLVVRVYPALRCS